jgi:NADPH:quinone reductase-like Zn-dependent oxidoreductase
VVPAFPVPDYALNGELVTAPARAVVKHPERLSWEEAGALWMAYSTAYGALIDIAGLKKLPFFPERIPCPCLLSDLRKPPYGRGLH